jgi:hypothetical protein
MSSIAAIPGVFQSAVDTMDRSQRELKKDASVVATSMIEDAQNSASKDTVAALVDAREQVLYAKAAAKLIRADDIMTKALLDIHA